jgi:hypothetical protein
LCSFFFSFTNIPRNDRFNPCMGCRFGSIVSYNAIFAAPARDSISHRSIYYHLQCLMLLCCSTLSVLSFEVAFSFAACRPFGSRTSSWRRKQRQEVRFSSEISLVLPLFALSCLALFALPCLLPCLTSLVLSRLSCLVLSCLILS